MLRGEAELGDPFAKQLVLGLGLLFLGKQGAVEATVEVGLQALRSFHSSEKCAMNIFGLLKAWLLPACLSRICGKGRGATKPAFRALA